MKLHLKGRRIALTVLVAGLAFVAVALVIKCVIVPDMKKWPDDVDITRYYTGSLHEMLDQRALTSLDLENLIMRAIPIDITRYYSTVETEGNKAIVREVIMMADSSGKTIQSSEKYYAVDRKTLEAIPNFSHEHDVSERKGLTFSFPIGVDKKDYSRWVSDLQRTAPILYRGEEEIYNRNTCVFESIVSPEEVVNPEILSRLPQSLPLDLFSVLVSSIELREEKHAAMEEIVSTLPDPVPLTYLYEYEATYWIDPETGINIDIRRHEKRTAAIEYQEEMIPLVPVFNVEYQATRESINNAIDDAEKIHDRIRLWDSSVPGALIGIGAILIIFGIFRVFRQNPQPER
ncbi:MAG: porin PorA family protein [Dehalococcoidia bacterium]